MWRSVRFGFGFYPKISDPFRLEVEFGTNFGDPNRTEIFRGVNRSEPNRTLILMIPNRNVPKIFAHLRHEIGFQRIADFHLVCTDIRNS